jgi:hypothetical protein
MKVRFITEVGVILSLRRYWGGMEANGADACPSPSGRGYHNAMVEISRVAGVRPIISDSDLPPADPNDPRWPTHCDACGEAAPADAKKQLFSDREYSTPSGAPEIGDAYFAPWIHSHGAPCAWDNCTDPRGHLYIILPNGDVFDSDARARNCTRTDDRLHRCWVKTGRIEDGNLDLSKNGDSCDAGAGSIASDGHGARPAWHGFLRNGELV